VARTEKMQKANKNYYSSKGKEIYGDFTTFAQGKAIATANAMEFARDFPNRSGEITVCEYGIGKGDFAKNFLDEVKRRSPALYSRTRYHLFDLSEKMIADAKANLLQHAAICSFHLFDAAADAPSLPFDYCRINELLSDLPAELHVRNGNTVSTSNLIVQAFLSRIDDKRQIPFSFAAEKLLLSLCSCGKRNFRIDIFDYGFYTADDILLLPVGEWNRLVARKYGSQITVDLNFLQLFSSLSAGHFEVKVERQKEYASRVLGTPLTLNDSEDSLDYVPLKEDDGVEEDDGFYHMRVQG
jgi:hypothetical protein